MEDTELINDERTFGEAFSEAELELIDQKAKRVYRNEKWKCRFIAFVGMVLSVFFAIEAFRFTQNPELVEYATNQWWTTPTLVFVGLVFVAFFNFVFSIIWLVRLRFFSKRLAAHIAVNSLGFEPGDIDD